VFKPFFSQLSASGSHSTALGDEGMSGRGLVMSFANTFFARRGAAATRWAAQEVASKAARAAAGDQQLLPQDVGEEIPELQQRVDTVEARV